MLNKISNQTVHHQLATKFASMLHDIKKVPACKTAYLLTAFLILRQKNQLLIKLWFWIGPTAHIFVLIIAAILFRPGIYFIYTIGVANIYMIILWIIQVKVKQRLKRI